MVKTMSNTLFVFTNSFPYGHGETFIDNELSFWKAFNKVIVVSEENEMQLRYTNLPSNISIHRIPKWNCSRIIKSIMSALGHRELYNEISSLRLYNKAGFLRLKSLLGFTAKGLYLVDHMKEIISEELKTGDSLYLYSYWMNQWSYVSAILSDKFKIPAVTRAHRYDLYSERNKLNYLPLRKFIYENLDGIYPISENGLLYLQKKLSSTKKIHLYRLGTFDHGLSPMPENTDVLRIVSCSWMSPVKRIERIIEALHLVKNHDVEWIHIGDGIMADEIKNRATALPVNIKSVFKGSMTPDEIFEFYRNTQIHYFVNVSESEGIPVSIMEATSMGIPVIATNVGGTSEIVKDGINGYLLTPEFNPTDLAKILDSTVYNKNLRISAREIWDDLFNAQKNYSQFYSNLRTLKR